MDIMDIMEGAVYAQTSANTAEVLRDLAKLFFVHVIPAEYVSGGREAWEEDGDQFSIELGKASSGFFARELANGIALGDVKDGQLHIGVAGGRTVFGLFSALSQFPKRKGLKVEVVPLVTGPVPYSIYSADSIAELAVQKFLPAFVQPSAEISLKKDVFELRPIALSKAQIAELDWIVLGIGGVKSGSLKNHLAFADDDEASKRTIGDICSRFFDTDGREVGQQANNHLVRLEMSDLEAMAKRQSQQIARVVAVAGGRDKVDAMAAILLRIPRVINFLVTDELTARALIRKMRRPKSQDSKPGGNQDQIPAEILREYDGKWIAWDEEDRCVLGVGETFEEAEDDSNAKGSQHMLRFHHANWLDPVPSQAEPV